MANIKIDSFDLRNNWKRFSDKRGILNIIEKKLSMLRLERVKDIFSLAVIPVFLFPMFQNWDIRIL